MAVITRTQVRRSLRTPTSLAVFGSKAITAITRSSTTASAACGLHGFSVGDWVLIQGADLPQYNGPTQVVTVPDANNFTYTIESDPGASAAGNLGAQKGLAASLWGDGTSPAGIVTSGGYPGASVGAIATGLGGTLLPRVATTTAPTTPCRIGVYTSATAAPGTWRFETAQDATVAANDQSGDPIPVAHGKFILVLFWRVAGTAVVCALDADEDTSYTST